jgi:hypothetical protein
MPDEIKPTGNQSVASAVIENATDPNVEELNQPMDKSVWETVDGLDLVAKGIVAPLKGTILVTGELINFAVDGSPPSSPSGMQEFVWPGSTNGAPSTPPNDFQNLLDCFLTQVNVAQTLGGNLYVHGFGNFIAAASDTPVQSADEFRESVMPIDETCYELSEDVAEDLTNDVVNAVTKNDSEA